MNGKPHIVHILGTLGLGGAQKQVLHLVKNPVLSGYQQSIICAVARTGEFLQPALDAGIAVYECRTRWPLQTPLRSYRFNRFLRDHLQFTFSWRLERLLRHIDADLVHSHLTSEMYWQARAILKKADLPWVWTLRGLYKSRGQDTSQWAKALKLIAASESASITGVSQAALGEVASYGLVPPNKLHVIHNGIDMALYVSSPQQRQMWREQWDIPQDALVFGSAGRLISVKRFDLALDAFAQLARENDHVYFALAGDGELLQSLRQQAEVLKIANRVRFLGFQSDMAGFLNMLDVFVLSSDSEGLGNVLIEAAALNLPCIGTAVGGVPEILSGVGMLVPPNSVDLFAEAMRSLLSAEQRLLYSQKNSSIVQRFDMTHTAGEYKALYDGLLERKQNRALVATS